MNEQTSQRMPKETVEEVLRSLPDTATWDEITAAVMMRWRHEQAGDVIRTNEPAVSPPATKAQGEVETANLKTADVEKKARQHRIGGVTLIATGLLGSVLSRLLTKGAFDQDVKIIGMVVLLICLLLIKKGVTYYNRGRRYAKLLYQSSAPHDKRAPVLYLRSFSADAHAAATTSIGSSRSIPSVITEEEQIAQVMDEIGPFTAIGRPGEPLPELGAKRLYIANGDWQETIRHLLPEARLVLLRVGTSGGLTWEFEQVVRTVDPKRIVLLVPFDYGGYQSFRRTVEKLFPHGLPALSGRTRYIFNSLRRYWFRNLGLKGIVYFDPDWHSHYVELKVPLLRARVWKPMVSMLKLGLRGVFANLRIHWEPPPIRWFMVFVVLVLAPIIVISTLLSIIYR